MDPVIQGIILLAKSAITGESYGLPEDFTWEKAFPIIHDNNAFQICFAGVLNCDAAGMINKFEKMQERYCVYFLRSQRQLDMADRVFAALGEKGIDYLPIKGCLTKYLYPSHEMRPMGDADVLIHQEQYPQIREVMQELGFTEIPDSSDFDYTWEHPDLKIEFHKYLFSSRFADYFRYFENIWDKATQQGQHRWVLSPEDTFIYDFTHFAQHFRYGGIGCNHAIDLWVFRRSYPQMDEAYIRQEMEKLGMEEFYDNTCRLLSAWFEDGPWDEKTEILTPLLFGGKWGTAENYNLAYAVQIMQEQNTSAKESRKKRLINLIFPAKETMKRSYPKLAKWPLPLAWVIRWFSLLFFNRKAVKKQAKYLNKTDEDVIRRKEELESVGIKFSQ